MFMNIEFFIIRQWPDPCSPAPPTPAAMWCVLAAMLAAVWTRHAMHLLVTRQESGNNTNSFTPFRFNDRPPNSSMNTTISLFATL
jgi:hypothetical protein